MIPDRFRNIAKRATDNKKTATGSHSAAMSFGQTQRERTLKAAKTAECPDHHQNPAGTPMLALGPGGDLAWDEHKED